MKKVLQFFLTIIFLSGCSHITEIPFEHKYVIYLSLKPQEKFQRAFIDSTYRIDVPVNSESTGISNAYIFVVAPNADTFRFSESDTLQGLYYSIDSSWVEYGTQYDVNVVIGTDTIFESVNVPDTLSIYSPHNGDTVSLSNPSPVFWNSCEGCFKNTYFVYAYISEMFDSLRYHMVGIDTVMNIFLASDLFIEKDTTYTICVVGYDENNYYASFGRNYDVIDDDRAIGTIGATVLDSIVVWVKE